MRIRVSFGKMPRRLNWMVPSPPLPMFRLTVPPAFCGMICCKSPEFRIPNFSMSCGRYVSTGFGPVSSAVGIFEPVTMTRSTSPTPVDEGTSCCANEAEESSKPIVAIAHPTHQINGSLMRSPLAKLSGVYQTVREITISFDACLQIIDRPFNPAANRHCLVWLALILDCDWFLALLYEFFKTRIAPQRIPERKQLQNAIAQAARVT